jgi:hypothetical protein
VNVGAVVGPRLAHRPPGARAALLAPLEGGKVPAGFVEDFGRYQQMGDSKLAFDGLARFKEAVSNPFANGEDAARALQGIGLVAREAPQQRARDLAVQALLKNRFLAPDMETLRVFTLRDVALTADKETAGRILKGLDADAGPKREGPAGQVLPDIEAAWKKNFGVPTPMKAAELKAGGDKMLKKGLTNLATGLIAPVMAHFGWFPTAVPSWLGFLSFLNPVMPFLPYVGLVMGGVMVGLALIKRARARRALRP